MALLPDRQQQGSRELMLIALFYLVLALGALVLILLAVE